MNKIFRVLLAASVVGLTCASAFGAAGLPSLSAVRDILNQGVPNGFVSRLGTQVVDHKVQLVKGRYRFSRQGGASVILPSTLFVNLMDEDNKDAVLPNNAIIKQVLIDVQTTPAASGVAGFTAPFISVGYNTITDILAPTAASAFTGKFAGIPVGTAATMIKTLGASALKLGLTGGSVTSGSFNVFVEYYLSD